MSLEKKIITKFSQLETIEAIGLLQSLNIPLFNEDGNPRESKDLIDDLVLKINSLNRVQKRNLMNFLK